MRVFGLLAGLGLMGFGLLGLVAGMGYTAAYQRDGGHEVPEGLVFIEQYYGCCFWLDAPVFLPPFLVGLAIFGVSLRAMLMKGA